MMEGILDSNAFVGAIKTCISKYVVFDGRAARSEYWYWALFYVIIYLGLTILTSISDIFSILLGLAALALLLPSLAVTIRRLHDLDRSGWWIFISLVPIIGPILLIYWYCQRGTVGDNQFGADPLA